MKRALIGVVLGVLAVGVFASVASAETEAIGTLDRPMKDAALSAYGWLLYTDKDVIYSVNLANGGSPLKICEGEIFGFSPEDPRGLVMVYKKGQKQLALLDPARGEVHPLGGAYGRKERVEASWVPGAASVLVTDGKGTHQVQISSSSSSSSSGGSLIYKKPLSSASWSPDAQRILFQGEQGLTVWELVSGEFVTLSREGHSGVWSPDASRVAFVEAGVVKVATLQGEDPRRVGEGEEVFWSNAGLGLLVVGKRKDKKTLGWVDLEKPSEKVIAEGMEIVLPDLSQPNGVVYASKGRFFRTSLKTLDGEDKAREKIKALKRGRKQPSIKSPKAKPGKTRRKITLPKRRPRRPIDPKTLKAIQ